MVTRMTFSGASLNLIREALSSAIFYARNEIGMCPDAREYAEDIEVYEAEITRLQALIDRIDRKLRPSP